MDLHLFTLFFHQSQVSHISDSVKLSQFNTSDHQIWAVTLISELAANEIGVSFATWNTMVSSALEW